MVTAKMQELVGRLLRPEAVRALENYILVSEVAQEADVDICAGNAQLESSLGRDEVLCASVRFAAHCHECRPSV